MLDHDSIYASTKLGLGENLFNQIKERKFCIVGCGAVGCVYADMLVRTGAQIIHLIDGDKVELKNLNRMFGFTRNDVGQHKVEVLKNYLKAINGEVTVEIEKYHLKKVFPGDNRAQKGRDHIARSDIVVIVADKNDVRIECEELCRNSTKVDYLSVGVEIDRQKTTATIECTWKPKTPLKEKEREGYGQDNGSFASIILEASSVAFHMMLHHIQNPNSKKFRHYVKTYKDFLPVETLLSDKLP